MEALNYGEDDAEMQRGRTESGSLSTYVVVRLPKIDPVHIIVPQLRNQRHHEGQRQSREHTGRINKSLRVLDGIFRQGLKGFLETCAALHALRSWL